MDLRTDTNIKKLLKSIPECKEQLYSYKNMIKDNTTLQSLAINANIPLNALTYGLERNIKRATQNPCNYDAMRNRLIKRNAVNIAGYVNFLWQNDFISELKKKAKKEGIELNINIFPKHSKKEFQNYLAVCKTSEDLPEILIGKGFSSLMTQQFVEQFVTNGDYQNANFHVQKGLIFNNTNIDDTENQYHPFAVEEMVMVHDLTSTVYTDKPTKWSDLLTPKFAGTIMQMGKNQRDHFGFNIMLHWYSKYGEEAIAKYAENVKDKQHFAYIIKNMATHDRQTSPINIVHQFASLFIRSDARNKVEVIQTKDGNPITCHFFLAKKNANENALKIANYLYSDNIKAIIEKYGTTHISSEQLFSGNKIFQWVGWDKLKTLPLPYLKEYLSEIAYQNYKVS